MCKIVMIGIPVTELQLNEISIWIWTVMEKSLGEIGP